MIQEGRYVFVVTVTSLLVTFTAGQTTIFDCQFDTDPLLSGACASFVQEQQADDIDWSYGRGGTPSGNTGPDEDADGDDDGTSREPLR